MYTSKSIKLCALCMPVIFSALSIASILVSKPCTSNPFSLTYFATGSPSWPSPITRTLLNSGSADLAIIFSQFTISFSTIYDLLNLGIFLNNFPINELKLNPLDALSNIKYKLNILILQKNQLVILLGLTEERASFSFLLRVLP